MNQAQTWIDGAADDYFERNRDMGQYGDMVSDLVVHLGVKPKRVLEIGCGNGWRLKKWRDLLGCEVAGIEPSSKAVGEGNKVLGGPFLTVGTADKLPYGDGDFDMVVYGYCLWLTDPQTWFRTVTEADRVLAMPGWLLVHDFVSGRPLRLRNWAPERASKRERQQAAYFYEFSKLWLGHPYYSHAAETAKVVKLTGGLVMIEAVQAILKDVQRIMSD